MKISPVTGGVRQALRDATRASHARVDAAFSRFRLNEKADYTVFLTAHGRALGALEPVARPASPRLPALRADLDALGAAMPAPLSLISQPGDGFRWGLLYALEGSRLGGAMLVRQVPFGLPRAYLSAVHGKGGWADFQRALDQAGSATDDVESWLDRAVQGAQAAFALFEMAGQGEARTVTHD